MATGGDNGTLVSGKELKELMKKLSAEQESGDEGGDEGEGEGELEGGKEVEDMETDGPKPKPKEGG